MTAKPLAELYRELEGPREPYIRRAEDAASLTLPSIFPERGTDGGTDFRDPFQSVGAQGVASVTSKLLIALFPPGIQYFQTELDPLTSDLVRRQSEDDLRAAQEDRDLRDQIIQFHLEQPTFRVRMVEALKHLVVAGSIAVQRKKDQSGFRVWRLPNYVSRFDGEDNLLEIVTRETVSKARLPEAARAKLKSKEDSADVFTGWILNSDGKFDTWQEVKDERVPGSEGGPFTRENLPIHPARFDPVCGESYGRSMIERMMGDLASLEGLQEAAVDLGAEAARVVWLVNPNGQTRVGDIERAANGGYVVGVPGDVAPLVIEKLHDLQIVTTVSADLRRDLRQAFFMESSVQRSGERVTALEIATLARGLDNTQAGTYSALTEELQLPVLRMVVGELIRGGKLVAEAGAPIKLRIIAGLEGLGRALEFEQGARFLAAVGTVPPEAATGYELDQRKVYEYLARSSGIDPKKFLRDAQASAAMRKAAADAARDQALGPPTIQAGGRLLEGALNGRN